MTIKPVLRWYFFLLNWLFREEKKPTDRVSRIIYEPTLEERTAVPRDRGRPEDATLKVREDPRDGGTKAEWPRIPSKSMVDTACKYEGSRSVILGFILMVGAEEGRRQAGRNTLRDTAK